MSAICLAAVLLLLAAFSSISKLQASPVMPVSTQNFSPSRYAVAAAEINVANLQSPGIACTRKVLVRLDSVTGNTQILQLSIRGDNDPTVLSAVWAQASESGQFQPYGGPQQNTSLPNQIMQ
jgi:hypothetical protein